MRYDFAHYVNMKTIMGDFSQTDKQLRDSYRAQVHAEQQAEADYQISLEKQLLLEKIQSDLQKMARGDPVDRESFLDKRARFAVMCDRGV